MDSYLRIAGPICLLLLGASCRLAQHPPEPVAGPDKHAEDVAAITRLTEEWRDAWHAGDADALAAMYTDDPVLMPQNQPAVTGKETIRALYQSVFDEFTVKGSGDLQEVEVAGDWAFYRSTYTLTATPKAGGEPLEDTGKGLFIVKRQPDDTWKIARLIANSDLPPPGGQ
jgi:uncharacterized protein (TIGR02246 family)